MTEVLLLPTEDPDVFLRELATDADDVAYQASYDRSRDDIAQFDPEAYDKHTSVAQTREARLHAGNKTRMGIWRRNSDDGETFLGSANATPTDRGLEIGYWIDSDHTGQGIATLAATALSRYMNETNPWVLAEALQINGASQRVLQKAGFVALGSELQRHPDLVEFTLEDPIPLLFMDLFGRPQRVPRGDYQVLKGNAEPLQTRRGGTTIITNLHRQIDNLTGVYNRGWYDYGDGRVDPIISFKYHKRDAAGDWETEERLIVWQGIGYGSRGNNHEGQPPTWWIIGAKLGTIDPVTGNTKGTPQEDVKISANHYSLACIVDNPLRRLIPA